MNHARRLCIGIIFAALLAMAVNPSVAQPQNPEALRWLKIGLTEKDPQKKIVAYNKALKLDSLMVEAMYNLGLAYKKQQNPAPAERWFSKAYTTKPHKSNPELKLQIALELARANKRLGKLSECEVILNEARMLAGNRPIRAEVLFELGRCQFDEGLYADALASLREGEKLGGEQEGNFKSFIQFVESAAESQRLFAAAKKAIADGNINQVQALLAQIRQNNPAQKNLDSLTTALDSLRQAETQRSLLAAMYEQAQTQATAGNWEAAIAAYESLLQKAGDYKDAKAKLEAARQQLAQNQIQAKLEEDYAAGLSAMRLRNWPLAILAFEKVLGVDANFRDASKRLDEAQRELETESTETIVARYYAEGVAAMNRNDLGGALAAFEKVHRLEPGYREVVARLEEIDQKLRQQAQAALQATYETALAQAEGLYQAAAAAMAKHEWMEAVVALEKLQLVQPNYRDAAGRLIEARASLSAGQTSRNSNAWLYVGGALGAIVLLPLAGFIVFSPLTHARFHLLRGDFLAAARLYEKILRRRPGRVKLYPVLANIYLLLGRQDEQALKIYKTILQLNIAMHKRDEINTIVAQNYLTEGRTDSDAIAVLESALKAERQKQNQGK